MDKESTELAVNQAQLGRPTDFRPEYQEIIASLANNGATDREIAETLRVHIATLYRWKKSQKILCAAVNKAKKIADSRVVHSLYQNALDGNTTAQIFWLKNRQPDQWRDRTEVALDAVEQLGERLARARKRLSSSSNGTDSE